MAHQDLRFTRQHEWLRIEATSATIGITDFAQHQLTDIVFVELPELGRKVNAGEGVAVLESVKSVSDVYAPVAGEVIEVNQALEAHPERINEAPYGEGWIVKLRLAATPDLSSLMDFGAYADFVAEQAR
jgi:glycine cleavage system H protein